MTVRAILQEGAAVLRAQAVPVSVFGFELAALADDMLETMRSTKEGIGLAAPQVGVSTRLIVIAMNGNVWTMCNPFVVAKSGQQRSVEGCLSIPRPLWNKPIARSALVEVTYQDTYGNMRQVRARRLMAAAVLHEIDHLNGILITDYATSRLVIA